MNSLADLSDFAARLREFIAKARLGPRPALSGAPPIGLPKTQADADDRFGRFALELFALQFEYNAAYRRFCEARNARPGSLTHWRQIPAMPASAFKELELTSLQPEQRTRVFYSSGTTEQRPSRHFHNADSLATYEASLWPWFATHLLDSEATPKISLLCLTPGAAEAPHSSLAWMFETMRRKLGSAEFAFLGRTDKDGAWTIDPERTLAALRLATASGKPALLLGTAFSFVHLIDFLAERELRLEFPPGSRVLETGGYKGRSRVLPKDELHAQLTRQLGISPSHIISEYGMSELSSQAYDLAVGETARRQRGSVGQSQRTALPFRFPPWTRVQIISPETGDEVNPGETGLIRVFDLANVYSVMAIQTEDLGIRRAEGFELLGRTALAEPRGCSLMAV